MSSTVADEMPDLKVARNLGLRVHPAVLSESAHELMMPISDRMPRIVQDGILDEIRSELP